MTLPSSESAPRPQDLTLGLAAKLGSLIVHVEEGISAKGHPFDAVTVKSMLADQEIQEWLDSLRKLALLPVKR
jgi:hypothetical protein